MIYPNVVKDVKYLLSVNSKYLNNRDDQNAQY